jgi:hypothetical protein
MVAILLKISVMQVMQPVVAAAAATAPVFAW